MYAGQIMELGPSEDIITSPMHPYSKALVSAVPLPEFTEKKSDLRPLEGELPDLSRLPRGCSFHPRCPLVNELCRTEEPVLHEVMDRRFVACHQEGRA
jgi:oligopeptide/dipeptide ABC transporter ATP-binding protein